MPRRVLLDMDPGVDDALSLLLALHSPELEIVGLTTVAGNIGIEHTTRNLLTVLEVAGITDPPPIAVGTAEGLSGPVQRAEQVHGSDGLGGITELRDGGALRYPKPTLAPGEGSAEELIISVVRQRPGQITLIATGPLTNVARAIEREPELLANVQELIVMGGAFEVPGNVGGYAEFNMFADPRAAAIVACSGAQILWVGLDVTHQVFLNKEALETDVLPRGGRIAHFVADCTAYYMGRHRGPDGLVGCYLHDPLAVATAIDRSLVAARPADVEVVEDGPAGGKTTAAQRETPSPTEPRRSLVCTDVDADRFMRFFLARLTGPPEWA